jgi:hypothetical protein
MESESLAFKSHVQRLAIACIAASPLREILILHGGSAFAYCHCGGRVPKDVDFRLRPAAIHRLTKDEVMNLPMQISAVLSEAMPRCCDSWTKDADRIKRVLHVDLFTIERDDVGVVDVPVEQSITIATESLPLALANKCYLLFGLANRRGSATDLFDAAAATRSRLPWPDQFIPEIAEAVIRRAQREWRDDQTTRIAEIVSINDTIDVIAPEAYERIRSSIWPHLWMTYHDALSACKLFCGCVAERVAESWRRHQRDPVRSAPSLPHRA